MAKRYKCPYCEDRYERAKLVFHIDKKNYDLLRKRKGEPQGKPCEIFPLQQMARRHTSGTCELSDRRDKREPTGDIVYSLASKTKQ